MSERDELALTLREKFYGWMGPAVSYNIADEVIAAGYSKQSAEYVIRDSSGHVLDRWVESDDDEPCCDECLAWATGADVDEQTKRHALQDAINAAHERQQWAQQGVFLMKRDEA